MTYDYAKLRGRIVERLGSQSQFAKALGVSDRTISLKMRNRVAWRQDEIAKAARVLGIPRESILDYFFAEKVQ